MDVLDKTFELLGDERRRYALYYLEQQSDPVPVEELVEQVAEWKTDGSVESIPDGKFERIQVELYHNDLPKASKSPYIKYNKKEGLVELTGAPPEVDALIHIARVIERPERNP